MKVNKPTDDSPEYYQERIEQSWSVVFESSFFSVKNIQYVYCIPVYNQGNPNQSHSTVPTCYVPLYCLCIGKCNNTFVL
jgi:hypothetical protein